MKGFIIALSIVILPILILVGARYTLYLSNQGQIDLQFNSSGFLVSQPNQQKWQQITPALPDDGIWKLVTISGCNNEPQSAWKARQLHTALHRKAEQLQRYHFYLVEPAPIDNETVWHDVAQFQITQCPNTYLADPTLANAEFWLLDPSSRLVMTFDYPTEFKAMLSDIKKLIRVPGRKQN